MAVPAPESLRRPLQVKETLLMGPGPSNCSPRVLKAMEMPIVGHMSAACFKIMDEIKDGLRYVFQTNNELTLAISSSGHGGMEAVMCNLLEPGEKVLIAVNGIWGERACSVAQRYGAVVKCIEAEAGSDFTLALIEHAIEQHRPDLFFITQGESSTGVYQDIEGIGDVCQRYNCLFAVDTVASLGGVPFFCDEWGVDAVYTGSQKALGAPPGLTPISFSPRAQKKIFSRKTAVKVFYWDMTVLGNYWNCFGNPRVYHHTISSSLLYALREGLAQIVEEGLENVVKRHEKCALTLYDGLRRLGLQPFVADVNKRLPTVTTVIVPDFVNWREVLKYAMNKHSLEISGGLGPTSGRVFRIGVMGFNAHERNIDFALQVLKTALKAQSRNVKSHL